MSDKAEQTWRAVLDDGSAREVVLRWERDSWVASSDRWRSRNGDPVWCVAEFARWEFGAVCVEILAPGVLTHAELIAALSTARSEAREAALRECLDIAMTEGSTSVIVTRIHDMMGGE